MALPIGIGGSWATVFEDDFSGSSLDLTKWSPNWLAGDNTSTTPPVNTSESAAYVPAQVTVTGGNCVLSLIATPVTVGGKTYPYRSGMIQTDRKFNFAPNTVAFVEASINMTAASGHVLDNFPAFWVTGQPTWPANGEIDIVEGLSGLARSHFHYPGGHPGISPPSQIYSGSHTYGVAWYLGDRLEFYYDGVSIGTITPRANGYLQAMTAPKFVIVNLATRIGVGGAVVVPSQMLISYVRVWQRTAVGPKAGNYHRRRS